MVNQQLAVRAEVERGHPRRGQMGLAERLEACMGMDLKLPELLRERQQVPLDVCLLCRKS